MKIKQLIINYLRFKTEDPNFLIPKISKVQYYRITALSSYRITSPYTNGFFILILLKNILFKSLIFKLLQIRKNIFQ